MKRSHVRALVVASLIIAAFFVARRPTVWRVEVTPAGKVVAVEKAMLATDGEMDTFGTAAIFFVRADSPEDAEVAALARHYARVRKEEEERVRREEEALFPEDAGFVNTPVSRPIFVPPNV